MDQTSLLRRIFGAFVWSLLFHLLVFTPFVLSILNLEISYTNPLRTEEFYIEKLETSNNIFTHPISKSMENPYKFSYANVNSYDLESNKDHTYETQIDKDQGAESVYTQTKDEYLSITKTTDKDDFEYFKKSSSNPSGNVKNNSLEPNLHFLPKKLIYEIFYGPIKLGETQIVIEENKVKALVYTTGMGNNIYPFFASWETWIDTSGLPKKTRIYSKDSQKERKKEISFEVESSTIKIKRLLPEEKPEETHKLSYPLYDELSSFIKSWLVDYNAHERVVFPVYIKEKREIIEVFFKGKIPCKFKTEEKVCLELLVLAPEKSELLKRAREITVYLLEKERIPIEIRGKLPLLGSLTGKLKEAFP